MSAKLFGNQEELARIHCGIFVLLKVTVVDCFTCLVLINVRLLLQWVLTPVISSFRLTHWFNRVSCSIPLEETYSKARTNRGCNRLSFLYKFISKTTSQTPKRKRCKMRTSSKHGERSRITCTVLDLLLAKMRRREIIKNNLQRQFIK